MLYINKKKKGVKMETVLKFDKVILVKELNHKFKKVGDTFEIASFSDDALLLRDAKTRVAIGVVSFEDFKKHFVKAEEFKGWTNWTSITGFDGQTDAMYRTNKRKVQVKFLTDKVRAEAACHRLDDFNLYFGIQIAYLRCLNKAMLNRKAEYEESIASFEEWIKEIDRDITDNNKIIEQMINSLLETTEN